MQRKGKERLTRRETQEIARLTTMRVSDSQQLIDAMSTDEVQRLLGNVVTLRAHLLWESASRTGSLTDFCAVVNAENARCRDADTNAEIAAQNAGMGIETPVDGRLAEQVLGGDPVYEAVDQLWRQVCLAWNRTPVFHEGDANLRPSSLQWKLAGEVAAMIAAETHGDARKIMEQYLQPNPGAGPLSRKS